MNAYLRSHRYLLLVLPMAVLLQACAPPAVEEQPPEPSTLKMLLLPYVSFAPYFIAEEEGYFAEQYLQIEFVRAEDPGEALPAPAEGQMDAVAGFVSVATLNAIARGSNVKFVADKGYIAPARCTYWTIMVSPTLAESPEQLHPAQLEGQPIDVLVPSPEAYLLEQVLKPSGLTVDDIEIFDVPSPAAEAEALEAGTLAASFEAEPWLTRIVQAGQGISWMPAEQVVPDFQLAVVVFGPSFLEENPDVGKRFMVAYLKAVRQYNEGKTERNLEILAEHTGLDQELLTEACWPPIRSDGQVNVNSVLDFQEWAVGKGFLDSPVTEEQFWDPSFVEYATQALSTGSP